MKKHHYLLLVLVYWITVLSSCKGKQGDIGATGNPGTGCSVTQLANGAEIKCADQTTAVILNGPVGPAGADLAPGPYNVVEVIDPCGKQAAHDEVLLRLGNGQLLAHYSDGAKQFFALLGPGVYRTTDGTNCQFTVGNANQVN